MKLLFASDSFKGTLSSDQIIKLLMSLHSVFSRAVRRLVFRLQTVVREPLTLLSLLPRVITAR